MLAGRIGRSSQARYDPRLMRLALVVNPVSGRGRAPKAAERARETLVSRGHEVTVYTTRHAGDGAAWLSEHRAGFEACVAVGGDGTLSELVQVAAPSGLAVGIIPVGTANVVSRDLGIPRNPKRAALVVADGHTRPLDLGKVNDRWFLAMVGIGLDGEIVRALSGARTGPIRMSSYVKPTLRALLRYREPALRLKVDGQPFEGPGFGLIVTNTRNYGGLFAVCPKASLSDGWLDFQLRRRPGAWTAVRCLIRGTLGGRVGAAVAGVGQGRILEVTTETPSPVQVDGDYFGTTPIRISLTPSGVHIFAPKADSR